MCIRDSPFAASSVYWSGKTSHKKCSSVGGKHASLSGHSLYKNAKLEINQGLLKKKQAGNLRASISLRSLLLPNSKVKVRVCLCECCIHRLGCTCKSTCGTISANRHQQQHTARTLKTRQTQAEPAVQSVSTQHKEENELGNKNKLANTQPDATPTPHAIVCGPSTTPGALQRAGLCMLRYNRQGRKV